MTTIVKSEPPTQDINNNNNNDDDYQLSPEKQSIRVPLLTPQKSGSPQTPKSSPVSDLHSDLEDYREDEDGEEQQVAVTKGKRPPGAVRRRNERERNRVKHINRTFSVLRQHLPTRKANKKLSKVETLRSAADYIKHLRQLLSDHDALTAAINLEQALLAHNQRQRFLHQPVHQPVHHQQHHQQVFHRLQPQQGQPVHVYSSPCGPNNRISLNSSLCSPTGPVNSPSFSPMVSPTATSYHQDWEQNTAGDAAVDNELMDLASESCMVDLW